VRDVAIDRVGVVDPATFKGCHLIGEHRRAA
jgi:hypothetical protein